MGCGYDMVCWDCGVKQDVGYGSHTTWMTAGTIREWLEKAAAADIDVPSLTKNLSILDFLERHYGHRCEPVSEYISDCEPSEEYDRFMALKRVEPPPGPFEKLQGR